MPKTIEEYFENPDFAGGTWALVEVDVLKISGQVRRVNVTIPERILNRLDGFARKRGESRSGLLSAAALEYLAAHALD